MLSRVFGWIRTFNRYSGAPYLLAGVGFTLDQITKMAVEFYYPYPGYSIPIIDTMEFFRLTFVKNPGAAWGILRGFRWFFIVVALIVSGVCVWFIERYRGHPIRLPIALILGGGIGNMVDRIFLHSGVVDFLDLGIYGYRWPTFNVADIMLSLGLIWIAAFVITGRELPRDP